MRFIQDEMDLWDRIQGNDDEKERENMTVTVIEIRVDMDDKDEGAVVNRLARALQDAKIRIVGIKARDEDDLFTKDEMSVLDRLQGGKTESFQEAKSFDQLLAEAKVFATLKAKEKCDKELAEAIEQARSIPINRTVDELRKDFVNFAAKLGTCDECDDEEDEDQTDEDEEDESPYASFIRELEMLADKKLAYVQICKAYESAATREKLARKELYDVRKELYDAREAFGSGSDVANAERKHYHVMKTYFRAKDALEKFGE